MKVFLKTYGCTLNQADGDAMRGVLLRRGATLCGSESDADVIVLNTCTVKTPTEQRMLHEMSRLRGRPLVVAGCMASAQRAAIEAHAPHAALVGTGAISRIYDAVLAAQHGEGFAAIDGEPKDALPRERTGVIARVAIAEGCTGACAFCQTRIARGALRSYGAPALLAQIACSVNAGAREIQLASQDTGAYGVDAGTGIAELLERIDAVKGRFMVRVGMMNPQHAKRLLPQLLEAYRGEKVYKFLHLPLQSGSERVLRSMRRAHGAGEFFDVVSAFRNAFPEVTLATDVIVGYPTETENDFEETVEAIESAAPDIVNVSKFTARPGTEAALLKPLGSGIVKERSSRMSALCRRIALEKNKALVGRRYEVLVTETARGYNAARNANYKQVLVSKAHALGSFANVKITRATQCCLFGKG